MDEIAAEFPWNGFLESPGVPDRLSRPNQDLAMRERDHIGRAGDPEEPAMHRSHCPISQESDFNGTESAQNTVAGTAGLEHAVQGRVRRQVQLRDRHGDRALSIKELQAGGHAALTGGALDGGRSGTSVDSSSFG